MNNTKDKRNESKGRKWKNVSRPLPRVFCKMNKNREQQNEFINTIQNRKGGTALVLRHQNCYT